MERKHRGNQEGCQLSQPQQSLDSSKVTSVPGHGFCYRLPFAWNSAARVMVPYTSASPSALVLILPFLSGVFTTMNDSSIACEFDTVLLFRRVSVALEILRQLIRRFDLTQLLGEISDVSSSSTVSHERRLLRPGMLIPCCSFSEGRGCYFVRRGPLSCEAGGGGLPWRFR